MRKLEFLVGLFVLTGIAAAVFLAVKIGGAQLMPGDKLVLKARFSSISGLNEGSRVQIGGVRVGTVSGISLDKEDFAAIVELSLDKDLVLHDDTFAAIKSSGLIGDKFVSLSPGGSGTHLKGGDMIVDTESSVDIEQLIGNFAFGSINKNEEEAEGEGTGDDGFGLGLDDLPPEEESEEVIPSQENPEEESTEPEARGDLLEQGQE